MSAAPRSVPLGLVAGGRFDEWRPQPVRFVACDLDGTFLGADEHPLPEVLAATVAALETGIGFSFATGRLPAGLPTSALAHYSLFGPHITHNGAQVIGGSRPGDTDAVWPLRPAQVAGLVALCGELGLYGEFYERQRMLVSAADPRAEESWRTITGYPDAVMAEWDNSHTITKATLVAFDPIDADHGLARVRALGTMAEVSTAPIFPGALIINVTAPAVGKGSALMHVLGALGIPCGAALAIGDGLNDLSMFRVAGTAVAMANAPEVVKQMAHLVAPAGTGVGVTLRAEVETRRGLNGSISSGPGVSGVGFPYSTRPRTNKVTIDSETPVRWGILGPGRIAGMQTKDLLENGFTVQAVGSRSVASSKAFAEKFDIRTAHGSYKALVEDPDVDAIYIATPHSFHHANALLALNAGKHVLVEKPFTINSREAREITELAESRGLVVLEAMWTRFLPHMARIREVIHQGTIGDVRKIIASHNQSLPQDPAGRLHDPALGGGALLDLGIYPVSFAFDILGAPESIQASASLTPTGVDRQTAIIFNYPRGQQALLDCELDAAGPNRAIVMGTDGWIDIEPTWYAPTPFTVFDSLGNVVERFDQPVTGRGMHYQAAELERRVRADSPPATILGPTETVAIMAVLDQIRRQINLRYDADSIHG